MLTNVFRQSNARTSCLRRSSSRNPEQLDSSRIRRVPETRPGYKAGADISRALPRTELLLSARGVGQAEIVAYAGAAEGDAVEVSLLLETADGVVVRRLRVARKVVSGGVQRVEAVLRAIDHQVFQRHLSGAQRAIEGVSVEPQFQLHAAGARDLSLCPCGAGVDRQCGRRRRRQMYASLEKSSTIHGWSPCSIILALNCAGV